MKFLIYGGSSSEDDPNIFHISTENNNQNNI